MIGFGHHQKAEDCPTSYERRRFGCHKNICKYRQVSLKKTPGFVPIKMAGDALTPCEIKTYSGCRNKSWRWSDLLWKIAALGCLWNDCQHNNGWRWSIFLWPIATLIATNTALDVLTGLNCGRSIGSVGLVITTPSSLRRRIWQSAKKHILWGRHATFGTNVNHVSVFCRNISC